MTALRIVLWGVASFAAVLIVRLLADFAISGGTQAIIDWPDAVVALTVAIALPLVGRKRRRLQ